MSDVMGPEEDRRPASRNRRRDVRLVFTGVVVVLLAWFALINLQDVRIHFWLTSTTAPQILVVVVSGVLGAAVALLIYRGSVHRRGPGKRRFSRK